jgi:hypothetical protein
VCYFVSIIFYKKVAQAGMPDEYFHTKNTHFGICTLEGSGTIRVNCMTIFVSFLITLCIAEPKQLPNEFDFATFKEPHVQRCL